MLISGIGQITFGLIILTAQQLKKYVFSAQTPNIRLDKQEITLRSILATETLNTIRLVDNGETNFQRSYQV